MEREGLLDDPTYIRGLPEGHRFKVRQNVFAFSLSCARFQLLQMLPLTIAPLEQPNPGAWMYDFVGGFMEQPAFDPCHSECLFPSIIAQGDSCRFPLIGRRPASS